MLTVSKSLRLAREHRAAGRYSETERLYRQILAIEPSNLAVCTELGRLLHYVQNFAAAAEMLQRATYLSPSDASLHNDLGNALAALEMWSDAESAFRQAVTLQKHFPPALSNWGIVLRHLHRWEEAAQAQHESLRQNPEAAQTHFNLGNLLADQEDYAAATASFQEALRLQPDHVEAGNNLGLALRNQKRFAEAEVAYLQALKIFPDSALIWTNYANVLRDLDRFSEAEAAYRKVLGAFPDFTPAYLGLGAILWQLGRFSECEQWHDKAFHLNPDDADVRFNRSLYALISGKWSTGWLLYEARLQTEKALRSQPRFSQPRWKGQPLQGQRVLLHPEQGVGDILQFIRYVHFVTDRGGVALVQCTPSLHRLLAASFPEIALLLSTKDPLPDFDLHLPILSLTYVAKVHPEKSPAPLRYLTPPANLLEKWRERLPPSGAPTPVLRVGLVWAGNPDHQNDRRRSIPLRLFAPLFQIAGIQWFSLQLGVAAAQRTECVPSSTECQLTDVLVDFTADFSDYADTAAFVTHLDLVIAVDTSVAHLAGGLGIPTWVLISSVPDWRWGLERSNTPWYASMRLFRQTSPGNWEPVIASVSQALTALASRQNPAP